MDTWPQFQTLIPVNKNLFTLVELVIESDTECGFECRLRENLVSSKEKERLIKAEFFY